MKRFTQLVALLLGFLGLTFMASSPTLEKKCGCSHEIPDGYVPDNSLICACSNTHTGKGVKCTDCQGGTHQYITYAEYRKQFLEK